ncbi:hypothetical protein D9615_006990 [Tricholomella constricta]|uniref:Uncharacterized protein n=1 Tax=Tricholomella constricta TaxID=117010 RepID=A0A8H5H8R4_9AGAR|nr:hypothetical protein D9615_006990 [Tricholomella constricta]
MSGFPILKNRCLVFDVHINDKSSVNNEIEYLSAKYGASGRIITRSPTAPLANYTPQCKPVDNRFMPRARGLVSFHENDPQHYQETHITQPIFQGQPLECTIIMKLKSHDLPFRFLLDTAIFDHAIQEVLRRNYLIVDYRLLLLTLVTSSSWIFSDFLPLRQRPLSDYPLYQAKEEPNKVKPVEPHKFGTVSYLDGTHVYYQEFRDQFQLISDLDPTKTAQDLDIIIGAAHESWLDREINDGRVATYDGVLGLVPSSAENRVMTFIETLIRSNIIAFPSIKFDIPIGLIPRGLVIFGEAPPESYECVPLVKTPEKQAEWIIECPRKRLSDRCFHSVGETIIIDTGTEGIFIRNQDLVNEFYDSIEGSKCVDGLFIIPMSTTCDKLPILEFQFRDGGKYLRISPATLMGSSHPEEKDYRVVYFQSTACFGGRKEGKPDIFGLRWILSAINVPITITINAARTAVVAVCRSATRPSFRHQSAITMFPSTSPSTLSEQPSSLSVSPPPAHHSAISPPSVRHQFAINVPITITINAVRTAIVAGPPPAHHSAIIPPSFRHHSAIPPIIPPPFVVVGHDELPSYLKIHWKISKKSD